MKDLLTKFLEKITKIEKKYVNEEITVEEKYKKLDTIINMEIVSVDKSTQENRQRVIASMSECINEGQLETLKNLLHAFTVIK